MAELAQTTRWTESDTRSTTQEADYYPWVICGLASFLLFVLLAEWIRPLSQLSAVTGIYVIEPFILAIFGFVALDYLRLNVWIVWPLKLTMSWLMISIFFHRTYIYELSWWDQYIALTWRDLEMLLSGRTTLISGENRTLLLLFGLSLIVYALHHLIVRRQLCGWFVTITVAYLAILQLGFGLNTTRGVIISLTAGLIMSALLQPVRWRSKLALMDATASDSSKSDRRSISESPILEFSSSVTSIREVGKRIAGLIGSLVIIATAILAGWMASKDQPRVSEPVRWNVHQFVHEMAMLARGSLPAVRQDWSKLAQTGYPSEDYPLGGSVIPSHTPVFTARSEKLTYWRGESKAYYDGSGWSDGDVSLRSRTDLLGATDARDHDHIPQRVDAVEPIIQEVTMDRTASLFLDNILFVGGQITSLQQISSTESGILEEGSYELRSLSPSQRYSIEAGDEIVSSYRVQVMPIPHDGLDAHMVDQLYRSALDEGVYKALSAEEHAYYTQLPDRMSRRVYDLAAHITSDAHTDLAKARAIATYLRSNYAYDMTKPVKPDEHEEFVEHFLFEQKFGYCDHFSTSMSVLLRMNGIPSRWVKGFAPGEVTIDESGQVASEVRALHAHSWVEGYIPEIGWVAFEPTPSYASSLESAGIVQAMTTSASEGLLESTWWQGPATALLSQVNKEVEEMGGDWRSWIEHKLSDLQEQTSFNLLAVTLWAGGLALIAGSVLILMWRLRHTIRRRRIERTVQMMERRGGMAMMLEQLWQDVIRKHGPLKPGQTLREYVLTLELRKPEQQEALIELATLYESIRYDERLPERVSRGRMSRLWRSALG